MKEKPPPENDPERALYLATEELAYHPDFLDELMRSSVILLAHPGWGGIRIVFTLYIHWPCPSDQTPMVIPCFSSPLVAQASINVVSKIHSSLEDYSDHYVEVPFSELAPMGYPNVIFQLNPVSPFGAELYPDDIGLLLGGGKYRHRRKSTHAMTILSWLPQKESLTIWYFLYHSYSANFQILIAPIYCILPIKNRCSALLGCH